MTTSLKLLLTHIFVAVSITWLPPEERFDPLPPASHLAPIYERSMGYCRFCSADCTGNSVRDGFPRVYSLVKIQATYIYV